VTCPPMARTAGPGGIPGGILRRPPSDARGLIVAARSRPPRCAAIAIMLPWPSPPEAGRRAGGRKRGEGGGVGGVLGLAVPRLLPSMGKQSPGRRLFGPLVPNPACSLGWPLYPSTPLPLDPLTPGPGPLRLRGTVITTARKGATSASGARPTAWPQHALLCPIPFHTPSCQARAGLSSP